MSVLLGVGGISADDATAQHNLGQLYTAEDGNIYRYVKFVDQAAAINEVVYAASATQWDVTTDYTGGSGLSAKVVGVAQAAVTVNQHGWILVSGAGDVRCDGSVAAGEGLIGHTVDGEADTMAAGEEHLVFGFALEADSGSPVTAYSQVHCL